MFDTMYRKNFKSSTTAPRGTITKPPGERQLPATAIVGPEIKGGGPRGGDGMGVCRGEGGLRLYKELCTEIKHCTLKNKTGRGAAELQEGGGGVQDELSPPSQCLRCVWGGGGMRDLFVYREFPLCADAGTARRGVGGSGGTKLGVGTPPPPPPPPRYPSQNPVGSAWQRCRAVI